MVKGKIMDQKGILILTKNNLIFIWIFGSS